MIREGVAKLFGLEESFDALDSWGVVFGEPWARQKPAAMVLAAVAVVLIAGWFYFRAQKPGPALPRLALALLRGAALAAIVFLLADPVLQITYTHHPRPMLYVGIDGTESMTLRDEWSPQQRLDLDRATGRGQFSSTAKPTRTEYVQALLRKADGNVFARLHERFRVRYFLIERSAGVDVLGSTDLSGQGITPAEVAAKLTADGDVTNLAAALDDLQTRHATERLAAVVLISDFDQNAGPPPTGASSSAAMRLKVPIYAVGVGPESATDLKVDLSAPPVIKKGEKRHVSVALEQQGFDGQTVTVSLSVRRAAGEGLSDSSGDGQIEIGRKSVALDGRRVDVPPIEFVPQESGQFELFAEVAPLDQESVTANNRAARPVQILDDFLRLLFVEYEPTWEWRFIKEVFHRDRLVGMRGFRTYLHSAAPKVKQSKELFVPSLTPRSRGEFFSHDVIFLGDVPPEILTRAFCDRLEEFVGTFGGGLVVMAGPRFGPSRLAQNTGNPDIDAALRKLRDMLPVEVEPGMRLREGRFQMQITPAGRQTEFMRLPGMDRTNNGAWDYLGALPWYQPVRRPHKLAQVLAVHPTDTCDDDRRQPQPLIALRQYGKGQVVYIGFNETWRLRRKWGEQYYRQFWGQLIHQLGFSHALGGDKRFIARIDNDQARYRAGDNVVLTIEAYDDEYRELTEEKQRTVTARLFRPDRSGQVAEGASASEEFNVPLLRPGVFEARFQVLAEGDHRLQVHDPMTNQWKPPISFTVSSRSAELRSAVRNTALQTALARDTGGKAYDLITVSQLPDDIQTAAKPETRVESRSLWNTWFMFTAVTALLLAEWLVRKLVNMP